MRNHSIKVFFNYFKLAVPPAPLALTTELLFVKIP